MRRVHVRALADGAGPKMLHTPFAGPRDRVDLGLLEDRPQWPRPVTIGQAEQMAAVARIVAAFAGQVR